MADMAAMIPPAALQYLCTIASLAEEGIPPRQARIAERLGKSAPSVSQMVHRLAAGGYLRRAGRQVILTPEGAVVAETAMRKHRLVQRFLVDVLGVSPDDVSRDAPRYAAAVSDDVGDRLAELLAERRCGRGILPRTPMSDGGTVRW